MDLICLLLYRVVDVHNINFVINVLEAQEVACLYCRMGLLTLFNPMKPEGWHCLSLANREERIVAKILIILSVEEPGTNWIEPSFRWKYDAPGMPGWSLPDRWTDDKHFPRVGFVQLEYYCGGVGRRNRQQVRAEEMRGNGGCKAEVPLRKSMLYLVSLRFSTIPRVLSEYIYPT